MTETVSSLPLPPDELIDRVVSGFSNEDAEEHRALFLKTGRRSLEDLQTSLAAVGDTLDNHDAILEFGCGCGRIMRWMGELGDTRRLVGTDIDARAIEWASANLPFARFDVNEGMPPTRYSDGEFDLIVNHSVFTHLDERYQDLWLTELQRITAANGILVLSIHGEHAFYASERQLETGSRLRHEWRATLERDGILFVADDSYVGSAFPDFYHTAFHAPWYVFEHWSRWFEVLAYLPRSSLDFQDQVVLRRRDDSADQATPIRARSTVETPSPAPAMQHHDEAMLPDVGDVLMASTDASRFGWLGLVVRRALFRVARPVLHAQRQVDSSLARAISALDERVDESSNERMPPLVHVVMRQQAERIDRLDGEVQALRKQAGGDEPSDAECP